MKQTESNPVFFCARATPFGPVAVVWSICGGAPGIGRILIPKPGVPAGEIVRNLFPNSPASSCSEIHTLLDDIEAFLNGEDIRFSLDAFRLDRCSAFQQRVLRAKLAIPRGCISTYRLVAQHLADPKAARAVGTALATNPFPIVVPCHRAIRSDGTLGGYQGGLKMKRALLEMEGIDFCDADHVAARVFFYEERESVEEGHVPSGLNEA